HPALLCRSTDTPPSYELEKIFASAPRSHDTIRSFDPRTHGKSYVLFRGPEVGMEYALRGGDEWWTTDDSVRSSALEVARGGELASTREVEVQKGVRRVSPSQRRHTQHVAPLEFAPRPDYDFTVHDNPGETAWCWSQV